MKHLFMYSSLVQVEWERGQEAAIAGAAIYGVPARRQPACSL